MRTWMPILWALASAPCVALSLQGPAAAWTAFLAYETGCALAAWCGRGSLGSRPPWRDLLLAVGLGFALVFVLGVLAYGLGFRPRPPAAWSAWGLAAPEDRLILLAYAGLNPWVEEWFWRGTLLTAPVRERLGTKGARLLAALGFVPFHLVFLVPSFGLPMGSVIGASILLASFVWVALRERQGHAWVAAASHGGADWALVALYLLFLR